MKLVHLMLDHWACVGAWAQRTAVVLKNLPVGTQIEPIDNPHLEALRRAILEDHRQDDPLNALRTYHALDAGRVAVWASIRAVLCVLAYPSSSQQTDDFRLARDALERLPDDVIPGDSELMAYAEAVFAAMGDRRLRGMGLDRYLDLLELLLENSFGPSIESFARRHADLAVVICLAEVTNRSVPSVLRPSDLGAPIEIRDIRTKLRRAPMELRLLSTKRYANAWTVWMDATLSRPKSPELRGRKIISLSWEGFDSAMDNDGHMYLCRPILLESDRMAFGRWKETLIISLWPIPASTLASITLRSDNSVLSVVSLDKSHRAHRNWFAIETGGSPLEYRLAPIA